MTIDNGLHCPVCWEIVKDPQLEVCIDCGYGLDRVDLDDARYAQVLLTNWLGQAGQVVQQLAQSAPGSAKYTKAAEMLARRHQVYQRTHERIEELSQAEDAPFRYPFAVRWAREMGWLEVRDCFTGQWHQIPASDAPDRWRWWAQDEKKRKQRDRRTRPAAA
jgi:hypothetical protein